MLAILLQVNSITDKGAVSADWTLTGAMIIIGFLLVFIAGFIGRSFILTLDTIKDELKEHSKMHDKHDENHQTLKTDFLLLKESHNRKHAEETAAIIMAKLKVAGSRPKGFYDNETDE